MSPFTKSKEIFFLCSKYSTLIPLDSNFLISFSLIILKLSPSIIFCLILLRLLKILSALASDFSSNLLSLELNAIFSLFRSVSTSMISRSGKYLLAINFTKRSCW